MKSGITLLVALALFASSTVFAQENVPPPPPPDAPGAPSVADAPAPPAPAYTPPAAAPAPVPAFQHVRLARPNVISIELLGRAVLYSVNYERYFLSWLGLGVGIAGFGSADGALGLIPIYISLNPVGDVHSLYLTAGATVVAGTFSSFDTTASGTGVLGNAGVGYQMQTRGGFFMRVTANILFGEGGWLLWPGLNLGGSF